VTDRHPYADLLDSQVGLAQSRMATELAEREANNAKFLAEIAAGALDREPRKRPDTPVDPEQLVAALRGAIMDAVHHMPPTLRYFDPRLYDLLHRASRVAHTFMPSEVGGKTDA